MAMLKSFKMPKEYPESVNRRTDNTMTKRRRSDNDLQNIITQNTRN